MKCIDSGVYLKYEFIDSYEFKEWGETGIMLDKLAAYHCPECREIYPIIPKLKKLIDVIYKFKKGITIMMERNGPE